MQIVRRPCRLVNLDPAAEYFAYTPDIDIRDLVTVQDVAEELDLGPNGALVCAMEFFQQRLDWLEEQLADYDEDELFVLDCPGQIELYTHLPLMADICNSMQLWGLRLGACCCLDVSFMTDAAKLLGGSLMALSAMVQLELPHINLLTKCDLVDKNVSLAVRQRRARTVGARWERPEERAEDDDSGEENEKDGFCRTFGLSTAPWRLPDDSLDGRDAAIDSLLSRDPQELVQQLDVGFLFFFPGAVAYALSMSPHSYTRRASEGRVFSAVCAPVCRSLHGREPQLKAVE